MPGTPMKRRVLAALQARATRECGEGATIVDFACGFFAAGQCMQELAELLASDLGHPVSRSFVSWTLNNVAADAKTRLQAARRDARSRPSQPVVVTAIEPPDRLVAWVNQHGACPEHHRSDLLERTEPTRPRSPGAYCLTSLYPPEYWPAQSVAL